MFFIALGQCCIITTTRLAKVFSAELEGVRARLIEIEVDIHVGLHAFTIVGLADKALNEAKERVNSALKNSGVKPPNRENRRITVNLAPADIKKNGSHYDLAIAIGYLLATGQIAEFAHQKTLFVGELGLDGSVRNTSGIINMARLAERAGLCTIVVPEENAEEAGVVKGVSVISARNLQEVIARLEGKGVPTTVIPKAVMPSASIHVDLREVRGQHAAKRAIVVAAAGGHNLLLAGPPGVGKSLLAKTLAGILPPLDDDEALEVTEIWSAAGLAPKGLVRERPVREPHQTSSLVSIIGGGSEPKPGEVSLSHYGVLFLDEFPEFPRNILEALRAPIEDGEVRVARAKSTVVFPARFSLVAAMNPCPCGFYGDADKECSCSAYEVARYQKKISGPMLDRIDLQVQVTRVPLSELGNARAPGMSSDEARMLVSRARAIQKSRFMRSPSKTNAAMSPKEISLFVRLDERGNAFLENVTRRAISPRGFYKLLKVARTVADLEMSEGVSREHLAEAFGYRLKSEEFRA